MYDFDVVVVGSGPAGSVAARTCAKNGLKTLLLESRKLPRDKVCSGMVVGPLARNIIKEEFGPVPAQILTDPSYLAGYILHVPGVMPLRLDSEAPIALGWRKDLDFWMCQRAGEAGAEIRDQARVVKVSQSDGICTVTLAKAAQHKEIRSRFVIGADGANSAVRKSLFPTLQKRYTYAYRECYPGELQLEKQYFHWFFPLGWFPCFGVHHKRGCYIFEGRLKELGPKVSEVVGEYGFQPGTEPLWRDACPSRPGFQDDLFSGSFLPALGKVLLTGDATSLKIFSSGEGIGTALRSGLLAATSIVDAIHSGVKADELYLKELKPLTERMHAHYLYLKSFKATEVYDPEISIKALGDIFTESMGLG